MVAAELELDDAEIGSVTASSFVADLCFFPFAGFIMDKCGRKMAGVPALVVMGIGMLVLALSTNEVLLVLGCVILGVGNGLSVRFRITCSRDELTRSL
ncbi:MAG: hypothetical protein SGPRY_012433 [Prymnesium sp.]